MNIQEFITKPISRYYKRWNRRLTITKRQQFVILTAILTLGLIFTQLVSVDLRYPMVILLSIFAYLLTAVGLREDLTGNEWITLLTLPTLFTAGIAFFYFLLPVRWLTRLPVAAFYAVGIYALLLTENIYNVAIIRTIALLRAAHSIGFLLTNITFYLLVQTLFASQFLIWINSVTVFVISFFLFLQLFWSVNLESKITRPLRNLCLILAVSMAQISWVISLIPAQSTLLALFLTTCFYSVAGLAQQYLQEKLYRKTVNEFAVVTSIVFILLIIGTHWR